jgi:septin family protein
VKCYASKIRIQRKKKKILGLKFSRTHLQDLKDVTSDVHYESFRAQQLLGKRNLNNIYE